MAISYEQRQEVIALLVGMFDAAPNAEILTEFVDELEKGTSVSDIAKVMDDHSIFEAMYPNWLTSEEFATKFAAAILDGNASAAAEAAAAAEIQAIVDGGTSIGDTILIVTNFFLAGDATGTDWEDAQTAFVNKVEVATYFATTALNADSDMETLQAVVEDIDATDASVEDKKDLIASGELTADTIQYLTTTQDFIQGTSGDDMFKAHIFDNANTAQSGDMINGGGGTDTLYADIGNSQNFAITLDTSSVEVAMFRAQAESFDSSDNDIQDNDSFVGTPTEDGIDQGVQIDAERMDGTEEFWSVDSRASLTIEDIQRGSASTTIGWRDSDSGAVNYEVYFDNITRPGALTTESSLTLELLDLDGMRTDGAPLLDNPYVGLSFTRDGVQIDLPPDGLDVNPVQGADATYQDLVDGINGLLALEGLDDEITAQLGPQFSAINSKDGNPYNGTQILLVDSTGADLQGLGWIADGFLPPDSNVHTSIAITEAEQIDQLTQVDIIFDYVGSGSKSHDFVAGEISQTPLNTENWTGSGTPGIQQFNIEVQNRSWMHEVRSTNNALEVVNVVNGARDEDDDGRLQIDHLEDVRVVNAATMNSSFNLMAELTENVVGKYFDLDDQADDDAPDDNTAFTYAFGSNDDDLTLEIAEEAAAYEDFELGISMGAGNDSVHTVIDNDSTTVTVGDDDDWLDGNGVWDQKRLDQLEIATGAGDDFVWTEGAGDFTISTGSGDDVVYTDNSGNQDGDSAVDEVQTLTFAASGETEGDEDSEMTLTILGEEITFAVGPDFTAAQVAAAAETAIGLSAISALVSTDDTAADGTLKVTFTGVSGDVAAISVDDSIATDVTVDMTGLGASNGTPGTPATTEVVNILITDAALADNFLVTFDDAGIYTTTADFNLVDTDGSGNVETDEIAEQFAAHTFVGWTVTDFDFSEGVVQLTSTTAGDITHAAADTNLTDSATYGAYSSGAGDSVDAGVNAVDAAGAGNADDDVLVFTAADFAGTLTFGIDSDGSGTIEDSEYVDVSIAADDSDDQVAAKVQAALNAITNVTATHVANTDTVTIDYDAALDGLALAEIEVYDGAVKASTTVAETIKGYESDDNAATWLVNASDVELDDIAGYTLTSNGVANTLLYKSSVTVTFSGAGLVGASGVTEDAAAALVNGFEASAVIPTEDYHGNEAAINQAIKEAINDNEVLSQFLTAIDGPDNTVVIESKVDGKFLVNDLAINITAADVDDLTSSELNALEAELQAINNDSDVEYSDNDIQDALNDAVDAYTTGGALDRLEFAEDDAGNDIQGSASTADSDNVLLLGSGDNVAVLGTQATSNDVIVIVEPFGTNSILNFSEGGAGYDVLHFGAYLTDLESTSGSTISAERFAVNVDSVTAETGADLGANEVVIINNFTETATDTFAGLDASALEAAIDSGNTGSDDYANIDDDTLDADGAEGDLLGNTRNHIVMIENEANDGEYKVFHLTSDDDNTDGDFDSVRLLGTIDFGNEITDAVIVINPELG